MVPLITFLKYAIYLRLQWQVNCNWQIQLWFYDSAFHSANTLSTYVYHIIA